MDFRKAKKDTENATVKFEDIGGSQDSWDDLLNSDDDVGSVEMFSKFHGHFVEIELLGQADLLRQAKDELRVTRRWKTSDMKKVRGR